MIASQLSQLTPLSSSYTSPRALTLFSQLELNLSYFETHPLPSTRVDVAGDDGVVYRWFPRLGLEFHPLANFGALNNDAARNDPRVVNREKVNARYLTAADFEEAIDFVSIDVSFISLKLILPAVATFARGDVVALIKPQFEVGKRDVGKGGIVRDDAKRAAAVESVVAFAREIGFEVEGVIESPVKGAEGNVEYLMHADTPAGPPATTLA